MLLWMDSFDKYGSGLGGQAKMLDGIYAEVNGNGTQPSNTQVRTGLFSLAINGGSSYIRRIFGANKSTVGVGFATYFTALPTASNAIIIAKFLNSGGTAIATVTLSTTGELQIRTGNEAGTVIDTSAQIITSSAWQHIEIKILFSATVGACEIRVNEQTVLNASNINTDAAAGGVASNVLIGRTGAAQGVNYFVDDIYSWDTVGSYNNDFVGDKKVFVIYPDADTSEADWVPDTGSVGYSRINETTPDDANYIAGQTAGDISEFSLEDISATVAQISAVQTQQRMLKTDAGTATAKISLVSGSSVDDGETIAVTTTPTYYYDISEEDPATSAPWTTSGINAMLVRATRVA